MISTLADLDAMSIEDANALPYEDRDQLLDLIIADGRHQSTGEDSYRVGLYSDYFEEDMVRMLKVKAIRILPRGTTSSGFDGVMVGDTEEETRRNFQDALAAHFEVMRELGEPIPEPSSSVDYVEVAA